MAEEKRVSECPTCGSRDSLNRFAVKPAQGTALCSDPFHELKPASGDTPDEGQERVTEACRRCGGSNPSWSASSPLWNAVMRCGSINGAELFDGIVCAGCFIELADTSKIASCFRLTAEIVNVELETTTPSGRVWDEDHFMWATPEQVEADPPIPASKVRELRDWARSQAKSRRTSLGDPECAEPEASHLHGGMVAYESTTARLTSLLEGTTDESGGA